MNLTFSNTGIRLTNLYSPEIVKAVSFLRKYLIVRILLLRDRNAVFYFRREEKKSRKHEVNNCKVS